MQRWRSVLQLRNSLISSTCTATQFASFHSTPASSEKWKNKSTFDVKSNQQPSKTYIRYATRQKRADTKKALKNLLFHSESSRTFFQDLQNEDDLGCSSKKQRSRSSRHAERSHQKKPKRKCKRDNFSEDYDNNPERIFQATFGKKWYTWCFNTRSSFQDTASEFEWREQSSSKTKSKQWENSSDAESDDESLTIGSCSDRTILGLPPTGPLKTEDVKKAFHLSALKWHPDKHQGPSQAVAEEKFKLCVNAYKSLCNVLSPA